jgi:hypothetical protein
MTVPLIVLAAVLVALLVAGATLVLVGLVAIGQHRADGRMRLRMRALEQRLAALDRVNTDLRAANTAPLTRRSLECERERWVGPDQPRRARRPGRPLRPHRRRARRVGGPRPPT